MNSKNNSPDETFRVLRKTDWETLNELLKDARDKDLPLAPIYTEHGWIFEEVADRLIKDAIGYMKK